MRTRTAVASFVVATLVTSFCVSQDATAQKSDTTQLLAALKSDDPQAQAGAAEQSHSGSAAPQDPKGQSELLDLLDLKTREFNERV